MARQQLWVLAGGNGAGKSTFYKAILEPRGMVLVNADILAKSISAEHPELESYKAASTAMALLKKYLRDGKSFAYETVFSHPSKVEVLREAKALGYEVNLVFIHLQAGLHVGRVQQRVAKGGHDVPRDKIVSRVPRTIRYVTEAGKIADTLILLDNSNRDEKFRKIAVRQHGEIRAHVDPLPQWSAEMLFQSRFG
jgi:predicted ABC-type ATPase